MSLKTDWFKDSKWGIFIHFLAAPDTSVGEETNLSVDTWNKRVNSFDTIGLANQLEDAGVKYIFITLGQNSGHYCSPNKTYDSIVGINPSKCSERDLVKELYEALKPKAIRLLVYLPSGAPEYDLIATCKLKWEKDGGRLIEFQQKWEAVIREWSLRWGKKVCGWFIDGCYYADDMYRHAKSPNFESFAAAMKAGSPDSIVAFSPGVQTPVISITEHEDYTTGEISTAFPVFYKHFSNVNRWVNGAQYHVLSFLGDGWGVGNPRFPDEFVIGFTKYTNMRDGVVSWDVPVNKNNGLIPEPFFKQLITLKNSLVP
jgi:hypothetical protein